MKKIFLLLLMAVGCLHAHAQKNAKFKALSDSTFMSSPSYQQGNRYQKDAMLFMDMLADTHPYYVKKERREALLAKQPALLEACATCTSDSAFMQLLIGVLGKLHDKHTDLITAEAYAQMQAAKKDTQNTPAEADKEPETKGSATSPMTLKSKDDLFHYEIFPEHSICYLQFNQCSDARTMRDETKPRFDYMLEDMFNAIDSLALKTLVVDAQYNGGGSSQLCDELLIHLLPLNELKGFSTNIRFSNLIASYNPRMASAKEAWENDGHKDELYPMPKGKANPNFVQPKVFKGKVIFIQSEKTYSSAGMLMTLARDNNIGTIVGSTSSFPPSHYGEVLPYSLPNTGILGSISCKFFARPDAANIDAESLEPDVQLDLTDKAKAWEYIVTNYGM